MSKGIDVQIQTTSLCNARCISCPYPYSWFKRNPGKMTEETFNKVISKLDSVKLGGFRTIPLYENDSRKGFIFETIDGKRQCFAHTKMRTSLRFDVYGYDMTVFENLGVSSLKSALVTSDLIIMDEIGIMEKHAEKFIKQLVQILDAPQCVLASYQKRALWFYRILKARRDTEIITIYEENRNIIPKQIITNFQYYFKMLK